jgi:hypothetical protein
LEAVFEVFLKAKIKDFAEVFGNGVVFMVFGISGEAETGDSFKEPEKEIGLELDHGGDSILLQIANKMVVVLVDHPAVVKHAHHHRVVFGVLQVHRSLRLPEFLDLMVDLFHCAGHDVFVDAFVLVPHQTRCEEGLGDGADWDVGDLRVDQFG